MLERLVETGMVAGFGFAIAVALWWVVRRRGKVASPRLEASLLAERVRAVGRLVGLEVCVKEIATAKKGWSWLPPIILSQARLAMIFHFEMQFSIDLAMLASRHVEQIEPGKFRVTLPTIEPSLRLVDVVPYDIQDGRVLGLLDVIPMNAETQRGLMDRARLEAGGLFEQNEARYRDQARESVERQLRSLLGLFEVEAEFVWPDEPTATPALEPAPAVQRSLLPITVGA